MLLEKRLVLLSMEQIDWEPTHYQIQQYSEEQLLQLLNKNINLVKLNLIYPKMQENNLSQKLTLLGLEKELFLQHKLERKCKEICKETEQFSEFTKLQNKDAKKQINHIKNIMKLKSVIKDQYGILIQLKLQNFKIYYVIIFLYILVQASQTLYSAINRK